MFIRLYSFLLCRAMVPGLLTNAENFSLLESSNTFKQSDQWFKNVQSGFLTESLWGHCSITFIWKFWCWNESGVWHYPELWNVQLAIHPFHQTYRFSPLSSSFPSCHSTFSQKQEAESGGSVPMEYAEKETQVFQFMMRICASISRYNAHIMK